MSESRWRDRWLVHPGPDDPVPYHPALRITKGMRVRLPGGGLFEVLDVVDDNEGNPGAGTLHLDLISDEPAQRGEA